MSKSADASLDALFAAAKAARERAYAPYSRFLVGAAIRAPSGAIYAGCNVENAAYPQGSCAEAGAIAAMALAGERRIVDDRRRRRRRGLVHALRRLPPAHPRIRRRRDAHPRRRPRRRARELHAGGLAAAFVRAGAFGAAEGEAASSPDSAMANCRADEIALYMKSLYFGRNEEDHPARAGGRRRCASIATWPRIAGQDRRPTPKIPLRSPIRVTELRGLPLKRLRVGDFRHSLRGNGDTRSSSRESARAARSTNERRPTMTAKFIVTPGRREAARSCPPSEYEDLRDALAHADGDERLSRRTRRRR